MAHAIAAVEMQITEFAVYPSLPLLLFSGREESVIADFDGVRRHVIEEAPGDSVCVFDPLEYRVQVGAPDGTLYSLRIPK